MSNSVPWKLVYAIENIYLPAGINITKNPKTETNNQEYNGCFFELDNKNIIYREGKITPKKLGLFVAIYERVNNKIVPLDAHSNKIDFLVVDVSNKKMQKRGQFIFNKKILINKGIISDNLNIEKRLERVKGKLSFRLFPPWESVRGLALKTQKWQLEYFFEIHPGNKQDLEAVKLLFKLD